MWDTTALPAKMSIPYRMEKKSAKPVRAMLDRDAWIKAAVTTLAEHGAEGLRVEVLAKRLGVTKGSFYWHFKDRRDLQDAVLDLWKDGRIRDIRKQTQAQPGGEVAALLHTIEVYASARNRKGIAIEGAVRDWARRDAQAAAVVELVDAERLTCACKLFRDCGLPEPEARARSLLLYAYVFGVSLMRPGSFDPDMAALKNWIAERIAR
jgi:AcrR family transcriptional regulator